MIEPSSSDWIQQVKQRGWTQSVNMLLDVIEPLGPLAAQLLWVAQPAAGLFGAHGLLGEVARALEEPDGVEQLRQQLRDDTT